MLGGNNPRGNPSQILSVELTDKKTAEYPKADNKTYKFLNTQNYLPAPQAYYVFDKGLLVNELNPTGYKVVEILDDVNEKILTNLANGYYDAAYLPLSVLIEYWHSIPKVSKMNQNKYPIIAGVYNNGTSLFTAPDVFDLKSLDGKTVGITNQFHEQEIRFNQLIANKGLKTKSAGGTVNVVNGNSKEILNSLLNQEVAAVICSNTYKSQLRTLGFQENFDWNQLGREQPSFVLVIRNDILKYRPNVAEAILNAHVKATINVSMEDNFKQDTIMKYNQYLTGLGRESRDETQFDFNAIVPSYNPNLEYLTKIIGDMKNKGYVNAGLSPEQEINISLLNKVLAQLHLELK